MARLELEHVGKRFADGSWGVRDASFAVADGEFFILVGPSGCGKSTLLQLIAGLDSATRGEIRLDGRRVNDVAARDRNIAMVFQSYAIYPHMTVRENLAFPLRMAKRPGDEIERRVEETARTLALTDLLDRKPAQLSGGQRQRVAMGRAIVREPALFLMDEPLSNLDAKLRARMRAEIAALQARLGITTVYVTHDQTEAVTLGDRIAVLRAGGIEQIGSARELYARPANPFVAGFIGSPAMNFLSAAWDGAELALPFARMALPDALRARVGAAPRRLIAGLRPEHLERCGPKPVDPARVPFRVRVERVEWLGAELTVYLDPGAPAPPELSRWLAEPAAAEAGAGAAAFVARLDPATPVREGESLELGFRAEHLHLFDAETGARIDLERAAAPGRA
jgi:multiple sugar transport system ATP-binding protein